MDDIIFDDDAYYDEDYYTNNYGDDFGDDIEIDYDDDGIQYREVFIEEELTPQRVGCLPVFLAVVSIIGFFIFAVRHIDILVEGTIDESQKQTAGSGLGGGTIASVFTPEIQYWSASIAQWSKQTGIDANMIATVMQIESCGDPFAKSSAGAMGLFQVMPYHFENGEDPFKPATNAKRGLGYLQQALVARDGVVRLGFAGYNGGITGAKRPESQWPNETQRYVYWGTGIYEDAVKGKTTSERLNEWLGRGGASLCKQAAQRLGINP